MRFGSDVRTDYVPDDNWMIIAVAASLSVNRLGARLVLGDGDYYQVRGPFELEKIRRVFESEVSWEVAETWFVDIRSRNSSPTG